MKRGRLFAVVTEATLIAIHLHVSADTQQLYTIDSDFKMKIWDLVRGCAMFEREFKAPIKQKLGDL